MSGNTEKLMTVMEKIANSGLSDSKVTFLLLTFIGDDDVRSDAFIEFFNRHGKSHLGVPIE